LGRCRGTSVEGAVFRLAALASIGTLPTHMKPASVLVGRLFLGFAYGSLLLQLQPAAGAADFIPRVYTNAAGQTLPYRLLEPRDYDAAKRYPLVLFFHGAGERGTNNQAQLVHGTRLFTKPENRARFAAFVVAPQCPENQQWVDMPWGADSGVRPENPSVAMALAIEILDATVKEFSVDTNRLYVTGLSMGGYGTWDCLTRFPERFAAAVPVCGGGDEKTVSPTVARVSVWTFHSDDDGTVKVKRTRNMVAAMRAAGGAPKYFEYWGLGHASWDRAYSEPELLPWMFAQRLGLPDTYTLTNKPPELPFVARFPDDSAFPGQGPIRKWDWFRNLWHERRLAWWNSREKDHGAVVFLGDSITQGWGSLREDFPNLKVANRGISGDLTRGVLYRLKEDVLDLDPKAVVLLIGTNDLEDGGDPETIAQNMKLILARLKAHNPKMPVVVCKVMPSSEKMRRPADKIRKVNALVDDLVKGDPQFIRCDTWTIFANEQADARKEEFPDLLHPNAAGYAKFAEALRPVLTTLGTGRP
jgi:lysophospholipase L1-like esterase/poly(3-hydroxybutyrate) depolymerase